MSSHLFTTLLAQDSGSGGGSGAIIQLGILLLIPFAMYFFMIRPQRRRIREQQDLQRSIEVGDEVITTSGVYGVITGEDGDSRFWLEIDDDVQIRIAARRSPARHRSTPTPTPTRPTPPPMSTTRCRRPPPTKTEPPS